MHTKTRLSARVMAAVVAIAMVLLGAAGAIADAPAQAMPVHSEGTFTYLNAGSRAFLKDHGELTAVGETTITILRADGVEVTPTTSEKTCVFVDGLPAQLGNLVLGQDTTAVSDPSGAVLSIRAGRPKVRRDQPGCGLLNAAVHGDIVDTYADGSTRERSWDRGRISALTPFRFRILRPDGVSVVARVTRETEVVGAAGYLRLRLGQRVTVVSVKETGGSGEVRLIALVIRVHR